MEKIPTASPCLPGGLSAIFRPARNYGRFMEHRKARTVIPLHPGIQ